MRLACVLYLVAQAAAFPAAASAAPIRERPRPVRPCRSLTVSSAQDVPGQPENEFRATSVLDLDFQVVMTRVDPPRALKFKVFTPNGHLYQLISVPITGHEPAPTPPPDPAAEPVAAPARGARTGPPVMRPVPPTSDSEASNGDSRLAVVRGTLPVAGTSIMTNSLYGTWRAVPYLDDETETCGASQTFVLKP